MKITVRFESHHRSENDFTTRDLQEAISMALEEAQTEICKQEQTITAKIQRHFFHWKIVVTLTY